MQIIWTLFFASVFNLVGLIAVCVVVFLVVRKILRK